MYSKTNLKNTKYKTLPYANSVQGKILCLCFPSLPYGLGLKSIVETNCIHRELTILSSDISSLTIRISLDARLPVTNPHNTRLLICDLVIHIKIFNSAETSKRSHSKEAIGRINLQLAAHTIENVTQWTFEKTYIAFGRFAPGGDGGSSSESRPCTRKQPFLQKSYIGYSYYRMMSWISIGVVSLYWALYCN